MSPLVSMSDTERELEVVAIDDLNVDHTYQRVLEQRLVEKVLRDLNGQVNAVLVSRRADNTLWLIDGQHTAAALKLSGETEILAFVYTELTVQQEAVIRLRANNRRSDTPLERFHAQLAAQDPRSLAIQALLMQFGTKINKTLSAHTGISCVSTIERLYELDPTLLIRTLGVLQRAFGSVQGREVTNTEVIQGVFWFIRAHQGVVKDKDVAERLNRYGIDDLRRKAGSHRAVSGGATWLNFYRALVEVYNHHRPEKNRIQPETKRWSDHDQ